MATVKRFEDLRIWQDAHALNKEIILIAKSTKLKDNFKLKDQICSSAGSIMDNIAEGFERDGNINLDNF